MTLHDSEKITRGLVGVYMIRNTATGNCYIGASTGIHERWKRHMILLNNGSHATYPMLKEWKEHGAQAFTFSILELVPKPSELPAKEAEWIQKMKGECTVYNRKGAREGNRGIRVHHSTHARIMDLGFPSMNEALQGLLDAYEKRPDQTIPS